MEQFEDFWSTTIHPWTSDFDYLGHLTAAVHPRAYEQARVRYLRSRWGTTHPAYVVASHSLDYVREILEESTPLRILLRPVRIGRSSFDLEEYLVDASGSVCNRSWAYLAAWDVQAHRSRVLEPHERQALERDLTSINTRVGEK